MTTNQLDHLNNHAVFQIRDLFLLWRLKDLLYKHMDLILSALAYVSHTSGGMMAENCERLHDEISGVMKEEA